MVFARLENLDGTPFDLCGRTLLKKATTELKNNFGFDLRASLTVEFTLL